MAPTVERVQLAPIYIEKPVAVHEEIRQELVEEIQPIIEVEKFKTEVHQVTQPLFDKEIRPVNMERRTLNTEVLPEVNLPSRGISMPNEQSSVRYLDTTSVMVEKPAQFYEVENRQIIEEIQPVIYKETVVPTVIQETKPVYQKIVEGPTYIQETLPGRDISGMGMNRNAPMMQEQIIEPVAVAFIPEPVVIERVTPVIPIPPPAPAVHHKRGFHMPRFGRKHKTVETTTTTTTTTDRPALLVSNELLYADGVSGANTVLDGADPFNRDYLLADNPITHNEFARQPRDHNLPLKTAGPYLTSEPSIRGTHSRLVTPLGNGGDHYIDEKARNNSTNYNSSQLPANRI